jgi:hypothetical protein
MCGCLVTATAIFSPNSETSLPDLSSRFQVVGTLLGRGGEFGSVSRHPIFPPKGEHDP